MQGTAEGAAALSIFVLKFPSLYQCLARVNDEEEVDSGTVEGRPRANLLRLFGWRRTPRDTTIRRRLDEVCTSYFEGIFWALFQWVDQVQLWLELHTVQGYVFVAPADQTGGSWV